MRILAVTLLALAACAPLKVGPFVPAHAKLCGADPDCPVHYVCRFVAVDTRAACMPGESEFDSYPDPM